MSNALGCFAFGMSRFTLRMRFGNQPFAQDVKISAQHSQTHITLVTFVRVIATANLTIARLQRTDGRFNARVTLAGLTKLHRRLRLLTSPRLGSFAGKAGMRDQFGQVAFVGR